MHNTKKDQLNLIHHFILISNMAIFPNYANVTITGAGGAGSSSTGYLYTTGAGGTYPSSVSIANGGSAYTTWTTGAGLSNSNGGLSLTGNITMEADKDIKFGHISLKETITAIHDRLAILVPDPELLEKYEALKQAYEHYKLLEALVINDETAPKS